MSARLRVREVRTSMRCVLRLMRENGLLAPHRQPQPVEPKRHEGTILAERPNPMWGIDATVGFTLDEGRVAIFAVVNHSTAECLGIPVAKRGTRFEALQPVRQAVREQFGGFAENIACGVRLRHDHGSQFMSDDFQAEIASLGIESSPAFVREPEGNGCIERFFRTLKEQLLWVRDFTTLEELAGALEEFRQRYNVHWLLERLSFQSPRQVRREAACLRGCCMTIIQKTVQEIGCDTLPDHSNRQRSEFEAQPGTRGINPVQENPDTIVSEVLVGCLAAAAPPPVIVEDQHAALHQPGEQVLELATS